MTRTARRALSFAAGIAVVLLWAPAPAARATPPEPGDRGTKECRDFQLEVDEAIAGGPRARSRDLRTAARIVVAQLVDGEVSGSCAACILRQIARRAGADETRICGPDRLCGDGQLDPGEDCDDANSDESDACTSDCRATQACGRGTCPPGESCCNPVLGICTPPGGICSLARDVE